MSAKITVIVYILICFEVGILLLILPWTQYWEENVFLYFITGKLNAPWIETLLTSGYMRGAITGLGVLNILAGMRDIFKFHESVQALTSLGTTPPVLQQEGANSTVVETATNPPIALPDKRPPGAPPNPWEN
jgi:hypothetical protein